MARFCGKCGAELLESATFCGNCGAKCAVVVQSVQPEAPLPVAEPVTQYAPVTESFETNVLTTPAKKSKKGLIIAIIAAVLVVAITLTTIFVVLPMFKKDNNSEYVVAGKDYITFKSPDTRYYISGADYLDINATGDAISLKGLGLEDPFRRSNLRFVSPDNNSAYSVMENKDEKYIAKITYENDPTKFNDYTEDAEEYVKENNLNIKSAPLSTKWLTADQMVGIDELHAKAILDASMDWQYSDGYIYLYTLPSYELREKYIDTMYDFYRINVEDQSVEQINPGVSVSDYVVYDGWIYYCDSGWDQYSDDYAYRAYQAGLYKMRTDGSERTKLLAFNCEDEDDYLHDGYSVYSELSVYNGKLYYTDNTDPFNSILHRMDFDGSNIEKISSQGTYEYTFDASENKLYYITSSYNNNVIKDVKEIYEVDLKDFGEKKFAKYAINGDRIQIACVDSVLYFSSPNQGFNSYGNYFGSEEKPSLRGLYYDLDAKKATAAYEYATFETQYEEFMGQKIEQRVVVDEVFYWADYDTSNDLFVFYN